MQHSFTPRTVESPCSRDTSFPWKDHLVHKQPLFQSGLGRAAFVSLHCSCIAGSWADCARIRRSRKKRFTQENSGKCGTWILYHTAVSQPRTEVPFRYFDDFLLAWCTLRQELSIPRFWLEQGLSTPLVRARCRVLGYSREPVTPWLQGRGIPDRMCQFVDFASCTSPRIYF